MYKLPIRNYRKPVFCTFEGTPWVEKSTFVKWFINILLAYLKIMYLRQTRAFTAKKNSSMGRIVNSLE